MKIYLDTAQAETWRLPAGCPPVQGVTTNPSLVHKAGLTVSLATYERLLRAAADNGMAELMLQLPMREADTCRQWHARLVPVAQSAHVKLTIKLPCHPDWQGAIEAMRDASQAVLLTGLSNPVQLLWARSMGAAFVAPYVGRLAADGRDVWTLMRACVALQSDGPALLAASIKSPDVLAQLIACGAAAATLPPESLIAWSGDALTDAAIGQFDSDTALSLSASGGKST